MLSKSKFILGQQCNKSFWFDINNIEPTNPPDEGSLERLSAGNEVGNISKELFQSRYCGSSIKVYLLDFLLYLRLDLIGKRCNLYE